MQKGLVYGWQTQWGRLWSVLLRPIDGLFCRLLSWAVEWLWKKAAMTRWDPHPKSKPLHCPSLFSLATIAQAGSELPLLLCGRLIRGVCSLTWPRSTSIYRAEPRHICYFQLFQSELLKRFKRISSDVVVLSSDYMDCGWVFESCAAASGSKRRLFWHVAVTVCCAGATWAMSTCPCADSQLTKTANALDLHPPIVPCDPICLANFLATWKTDRSVCTRQIDSILEVSELFPNTWSYLGYFLMDFG